MKYLKWINKNLSDKTAKTAVVLGATGSFGKFISKALAYKNANLLLVARNKDNLLKLADEVRIINENIKIDIAIIDLFDNKSVKDFLTSINSINIDYFISTAGVYHLPVRKTIDSLEVHFEANYFNHAYILEYLISNKPKTKIIFTNSLSYRFNKIDYDNIESDNVKNKTKIYARSKRLLLNHLNYYKKKDYNIEIPHPGISPTTLFFGANKGYKGIIKWILKPLMKLVFQNPAKCALNILYSIDNKTNYGYQIGPRGLFRVWGYPKAYRLNKCVLNDDEQKKVIDAYNKILEHIEKVE